MGKHKTTTGPRAKAHQEANAARTGGRSRKQQRAREASPRPESRASGPTAPAKKHKGMTLADVKAALRDWSGGPMPRWLQTYITRRTAMPCPFCGGTDMGRAESELGRQIHCLGCNAMGPDIVPSTRIKTGHAGNALAVLAWNMRVREFPAPEVTRA